MDAEGAPANPASSESTGSDSAIATDTQEDDSKLITKFSERVKVPTFLERWYAKFDEDRKYVNEICMLMDDEDTVSTNYVFRNQMVQISQLYAKDPEVSFQPRRRKMGKDPMTGEDLPTDPMVEDFADTLEILTDTYSRLANFRSTLTGALQDAMTCAWSILKVNQQEDYLKDPMGYRRQDDQQDNFARLVFFNKRFADGEFDEDSSDYAQMQDCSRVVAEYLSGQLASDIAENPPQKIPVGVNPDGTMLEQHDPNDPRAQTLATVQQSAQPGGPILPMHVMPEVARFIGFNIDVVQPEDFRFDWSITRPEDLYDAAWMAIRVYMDREAIASKFQLSPEDYKKIKLYAPDGRTSDSKWMADDPSNRSDLERTNVNDRAAVWEYWDKRNNTVYVWVDGIDRFLQRYTPDATWRRWFPFFFVYFNRVTGRVIPLSDTRLVMPLQDEVNTLRTHDREARKAAYPRLVIKRGLMTRTEMDNYENASPYQVIEVEQAIELNEQMKEVVGVPYRPELYDTSRAISEMEIMSGVSRTAAGTVDSGTTATQEAISNQRLGEQADMRRAMIETVIHDIMECIAELSVQTVPQENVQEIVGPGAVWPQFTREQIYRGLDLVITPGSTGKVDAQKRLEFLTKVMPLLPQLNLVAKGPQLLDELAKDSGLNLNLGKFFMVAPMPMAAPGGMPGQPGTTPGGPAPMNRPAVPNPGGAPPMKAPPLPNQIPNHPRV
jgi:hypothetical protein